jgi:hypothetical protein
MLRHEQQRGSKEQQRVMKLFETARRQHQAELRRLETARDQARSGRRWLTWFRAALTLRRARRHEPAPPSAPSDDEAKLSAGVMGEQLVANDLGRLLNDDWVLFRGYRNRRGEIDHVLLGPDGLVAIEVKYINGTVHCEGDRWRVVKFDNYGNQVDEYDLVDRGQRHRSPSVQLNEPADALRDFLRDRGEDVDLLRVVQLTHRKSQVGTCRHPTVSVFTKTGQITALMRKVPQPLDARRRQRIEDLIVHDHQHHARARPGSR